MLLIQIVDTVYAKLLARGEKTTRLYTLIEESNDIILEEVESDFLAQGQYSPLCKLYERAGAVDKQLDLWSKYVTHFPEFYRPLKRRLLQQNCRWSMERQRHPRPPHKYICPSEEAQRSTAGPEVGRVVSFEGFCANGESTTL